MEKIIQALAYHNTNTTTTTKNTRTVRVVLTDRDGGISVPSDIKITVTDNLPPTTGNKTITLKANGLHTFKAAEFPFSDPEGDALQKVTIVTLPDPGILALSGTPVTPGQTVLVADLSSLTFTPAPGKSGTPYATFTFTVNDGTNDSLPGTMTLNVTPAPTPPGPTPAPSPDSDGDGTPDDNDSCPNDANKITPGTCGCGIPDTDSNQNGIPDCNDNDEPGEVTGDTFGPSGRLTGTVVIFFENGGAYPITIPGDVIFPSPENVPEKGFVLTPQFLLTYAKDNDWRTNIHSARMKAAAAEITVLPPISDAYRLINGLILATAPAKATSSVTVGIPYETSDLPEGYESQALLALVYDDTTKTWQPAPFTLSNSGTMDIRTDILSAYAAVVKEQPVTPGNDYILGALDGGTTEEGGTATFTLALANGPSADVTIGISSSDTTEGTVLPPILTFTPADWDTPRTVTLTGIDDEIADGDQIYYAVLAPAVSLDLNYNGVAPGNVTVKNRDNDLAPTPLAPINGDVVATKHPTLNVSALFEPDLFATHAASCWQIATSSEFGEGTLVFEIESHDALTTLKTPEGTCRADTTYYWRIKCTDDEGVSTLWSQPSAFTTPKTATEADGGGGSGGCFIRALF
ncbi:MAG: hypothetical protein JEZ11_23535 [Desulfobacterales bacterium]|nr:hypothetical protein [Desulfobacterales bacterium]